MTQTGEEIAIELTREESVRRHKDRNQNYVNRGAVIEQLKKGIYAYFILLLLEGALRKWVLPGLATPLLVVRDPVVIWIFFIAWKNNMLPTNNYIYTMSFIAVSAFFTALLVGHRSIVIALYGTRILLFHFPMIFLIGSIFDKEDVLKVGRAVLWISIPMFMLIFVQFYSPQSSFVNRGIGGDVAGGGFSGALGFFRPPGTFSFTTGNTAFFSLVAVYVIYFWLNIEQVNRVLLIVSTITLISAIPISLSRGLTIQIVLTGVFAVAIISRNPKFFGRMIFAAIGLVVASVILSNFAFFGKAIEVLTSRFDAASQSEGTIDNTIINRIGASIFEPFQKELPFFGFGIGIGTNAGSRLSSGKEVAFIIAEGEWGRLIGEMGAFFGFAAIILRMHLSLRLMYEGYNRLKYSNLLPWLFVSVSFQSIAQGQWAQPTALGFGVVYGGLTIAAMKMRQTT